MDHDDAQLVEYDHRAALEELRDRIENLEGIITMYLGITPEWYVYLENEKEKETADRALKTIEDQKIEEIRSRLYER